MVATATATATTERTCSTCPSLTARPDGLCLPCGRLNDARTALVLCAEDVTSLHSSSTERLEAAVDAIEAALDMHGLRKHLRVEKSGAAVSVQTIETDALDLRLSPVQAIDLARRVIEADGLVWAMAAIEAA